jgi:HEAT repeat protein
MSEPQNADDLSPFARWVTALASSDPKMRNIAASHLRELGDDAAVDPLLTAAKLPANANNRGSLVYALQTLDCSRQFTRLFDLALTGNYEVQCHALTILDEQPMKPSHAELAAAQAKLDAFVPPDHMTEDDVDRFKSELSEILLHLRQKGGNP